MDIVKDLQRITLEAKALLFPGGNRCHERTSALFNENPLLLESLEAVATGNTLVSVESMVAEQPDSVHDGFIVRMVEQSGMMLSRAKVVLGAAAA